MRRTPSRRGRGCAPPRRRRRPCRARPGPRARARGGRGSSEHPLVARARAEPARRAKVGGAGGIVRLERALRGVGEQDQAQDLGGVRRRRLARGRVQALVRLAVRAERGEVVPGAERVVADALLLLGRRERIARGAKVRVATGERLHEVAHHRRQQLASQGGVPHGTKRRHVVRATQVVHGFRVRAGERGRSDDHAIGDARRPPSAKVRTCQPFFTATHANSPAPRRARLPTSNGAAARASSDTTLSRARARPAFGRESTTALSRRLPLPEFLPGVAPSREGLHLGTPSSRPPVRSARLPVLIRRRDHVQRREDAHQGHPELQPRERPRDRVPETPDADRRAQRRG